MNPRLLAMRVLLQVLVDGKSLNACSTLINSSIDDAKDRAFARELSFGVLRWHPRLMFILSELITKPLKAKDQDIVCLLLIGFYQILFLRVPDHAAVSETVKLTQKLKKGWAKNLVNGVLRELLRERENIQIKIESDLVAKYAHPLWFIHKIQKDWPEQWEILLEKNNEQAPMTLRVNQQKSPTKEYQAQLLDRGFYSSPSNFSLAALVLEKPCDVSLLPDFDVGAVSVQDLAAQQAAYLLELPKQGRVLDACAAPGGKTAHILEVEPSSRVVALDISEDRTKLIRQTLDRLGHEAQLVCANAGDTDSWWDGEMFDRILLDAPCSATGVIRRNPDIKTHRTLEDVQQVVHNQAKLLETLWPLLKPGGILLYATCSVLKDENELQILSFLSTCADAVELKIESGWGNDRPAGKQILPGDNGMDGFYYARIQKVNKDLILESAIDRKGYI